MGSSTGSGPRRRRERGSAEQPAWGDLTGGWADASDQRSPYDPRSRASDVPGEDTGPLETLGQEASYNRSYMTNGQGEGVDLDGPDRAVASGDDPYSGAGWENAYLTGHPEEGSADRTHHGAAPATGDVLASGYRGDASATPDHVDAYGGHETRHLPDPGYGDADYGPSTGAIAPVGYDDPDSRGDHADRYGDRDAQGPSDPGYGDVDYGPSTGAIAPVNYGSDDPNAPAGGDRYGDRDAQGPSDPADPDYAGVSTGAFAPIAQPSDGDGADGRTQMIDTDGVAGDADAGQAGRTGEDGEASRGFLGSGWRNGPDPEDEAEPAGRRGKGRLIAAAAAVVLVVIAGFFVFGGGDDPDCAAGDTRCMSQAKNTTSPTADPAAEEPDDAAAEEDELGDELETEEEPEAEETAEPTPTATQPQATTNPRPPARPNNPQREEQDRPSQDRPSESSVRQNVPRSEKPSTSATEDEEELAGDSSGTRSGNNSSNDPTPTRRDPSPDQSIPNEIVDDSPCGWFDPRC